MNTLTRYNILRLKLVQYRVLNDMKSQNRINKAILIVGRQLERERHEHRTIQSTCSEESGETIPDISIEESRLLELTRRFEQL